METIKSFSSEVPQEIPEEVSEQLRYFREEIARQKTEEAKDKKTYRFPDVDPETLIDDDREMYEEVMSLVNQDPDDEKQMSDEDFANFADRFRSYQYRAKMASDSRGAFSAYLANQFTPFFARRAK